MSLRLSRHSAASIAFNCLICLRDVSRFQKRESCISCIEDQFCTRCIINGWCKNCYSNKRTTCALCHCTFKSSLRIFCSQCRAQFCDKCGVDTRCKHCYIKYEKQDLVKQISSVCTDISVHSIEIIVEYCIGYIVECGNQRERCRNLIRFSNKFEFLKCDAVHHAKGNRLYKYAPTRNTANTQRIYSCDLRIFCGECTEQKLRSCLNKHGGQCSNLEICGDTQYANICGDHPFCTNCEQRELQREAIYPTSMTRRWIYNTAPSTSIRQCIQCKRDFCTECIKYSNLYCKRCGEQQRTVCKPPSMSCCPSPPETLPSKEKTTRDLQLQADTDLCPPHDREFHTNHTPSYSSSSVLPPPIDIRHNEQSYSCPSFSARTSQSSGYHYVPPISGSMYEHHLTLNSMELSQTLIGNQSLYSPSEISLDAATLCSPHVQASDYTTIPFTPTPTAAASTGHEGGVTATPRFNVRALSPLMSVSMGSAKCCDRRSEREQDEPAERKNERILPKRGSEQYSQECVARLRSGRAPVIPRD